LFNVFHPLDPVSYRIEPLIFDKCEVHYIPLLGSYLTRFSSRFHSEPAQIPHHDSIDSQNFAPHFEDLKQLLNANRVDFVTHYAPSSVESVAPWVAALPAHSSYWNNVDIAVFMLGVIEHQETRSDFFSTPFGGRLMESISSFLVENHCSLDSLMLDSLESASADGERLLAELRTDPDASIHKTFEVDFLKQLGVYVPPPPSLCFCNNLNMYCSSRKAGGTATLPTQLRPHLLRSFESMAVSSINSMLLNATLEPVAGVLLPQIR
jgi:hypothetical protein